MLGCGGVGPRVWVLGCGCGRAEDGAGWMGRAEDGAGWMGMVAVGLRGERRPDRPTRIRIGGSGVIDRPTFRLPGSQMRACLGWVWDGECPHTDPKMARMPLGARRML